MISKRTIMSIFITTLMLLSIPSYGGFTDNLRVSLDGSARLNKNITAKNTSRIYALGLDTHKIFNSVSGDIGYVVAQLYFTKLSNQTPFPFLFDSADDNKFVVREAHLNYTAGPNWLPNIRVGHFTLPFGLEESIDTNGRLLDYYHGKNLGTKLDWGLGLNKVLSKVEYNISYMMGGKDEPKIVNDSYIYSGRIGSLSHLNFIIGLSFLNANIDNIKRKRLAIDWQYYWRTWGFFGEIALGKDDSLQQKWRKEQYGLFELNKMSNDHRLKLYSQYIITDFEGNNNTHQLINIGMSYQVDAALELSLSSRRQLNTPETGTGKKLNLVRFQLRYRY